MISKILLDSKYYKIKKNILIFTVKYTCLCSGDDFLNELVFVSSFNYVNSVVPKLFSITPPLFEIKKCHTLFPFPIIEIYTIFIITKHIYLKSNI